MNGGVGSDESEGPVLKALARIDELRHRGRAPDEIADTMAAAEAPVPGGGSWTPEKVERILHVFDSIRSQGGEPNVPGNLSVEDPTAAAPIDDPSPDPEPVSAPKPEPEPDLKPEPEPDPKPEPVLEPLGGTAAESIDDLSATSRAAPPAPTSTSNRPVAPDPPAPPAPPEPPARPTRAARRDPAARPALPSIGGRSWSGATSGSSPAWIRTGKEAARPSVHPLVVARRSVAVVALAGLGAGGFLGIQALLGQRRPEPAHVDSIAAPPPTITTMPPQTTATTAPPDPADTLAIRVETDQSTSAAGGLVAATATIRKDGKLHLEGAFADQAQADAFLERAGAIFGRENIVEEYVVDPDAPAPQVADVALDKPVLFERDTAEIDPDYIPFLEACAGVLALNPNIVMSIAAYTDASGSAAVNLELSQQRAQAIVDFYRERDIGDDQLIGTGFGEADPVAGNDSEAGRSQNRRAMLQLLNVMGDGASAEEDSADD